MTDGPYREGKPLDAVIAPDRRRQRAILFMIGGAVVGVTLFELGRSAFGGSDSRSAPPVAPSTAPIRDARPGALSEGEVQAVVARETGRVREACWRPQAQAVSSANVAVELRVGVDGTVTSASATGSDPAVSACVEREVTRWHFPAHVEPSLTIAIPFLFSKG